ncbi:hypothetical protein [Clostridium mediterraneense]|uniref:hypothetical protein n=1 Tax=Clostridium mediterraneense TaxID=1805472 RepID=UPI00082BFDD0|nr:hypothetical protein [Clostridium mediterraneense]
MIRTVVCKKEGCTGNSFRVSSKENKLTITCTECNSDYSFDFRHHSFTLLSNCSVCKSDVFKVFKDIDTDEIYAKCLECGNPPERVYIDDDGIQISYTDRLLNEVKEIVYMIDKRMMNLETKVEDLENGQNLSEESLAYITKFLTDQH